MTGAGPGILVLLPEVVFTNTNVEPPVLNVTEALAKEHPIGVFGAKAISNDTTTPGASSNSFPLLNVGAVTDSKTSGQEAPSVSKSGIASPRQIATGSTVGAAGFGSIFMVTIITLEQPLVAVAEAHTPLEVMIGSVRSTVVGGLIGEPPLFGSPAYHSTVLPPKISTSPSCCVRS